MRVMNLLEMRGLCNPATYIATVLELVEGDDLLKYILKHEELDKTASVRNVTKIPLFLPNFFQLLNLCFVILFCLPSLH